MLALELVADRGARESPAPAACDARSSRQRAERGLLLLKAGVHGNCIRVLVPLVITDDELDEALDVWEEALASVLYPGRRVPLRDALNRTGRRRPYGFRLPFSV